VTPVAVLDVGRLDHKGGRLHSVCHRALPLSPLPLQKWRNFRHTHEISNQTTGHFLGSPDRVRWMASREKVNHR
jgi:hypothetical protein